MLWPESGGSSTGGPRPPGRARSERPSDWRKSARRDRRAGSDGHGGAVLTADAAGTRPASFDGPSPGRARTTAAGSRRRRRLWERAPGPAPSTVRRAQVRGCTTPTRLLAACCALAAGRPGGCQPLGPDGACPDECLLSLFQRLRVGDRLAWPARLGLRRDSEREFGSPPSPPSASAACQTTERRADLHQLTSQPRVLLDELTVLALKRFVRRHQLGDLVDDATAVTRDTRRAPPPGSRSAVRSCSRPWQLPTSDVDDAPDSITARGVQLRTQLDRRTRRTASPRCVAQRSLHCE
jgi:hypothetical protein